MFGMRASGSVAAYFILSIVSGGITGYHHPGSEGMAMRSRMGDGTEPRSAAIPPIDAFLPGATDTATFALG